MTFELLNKIIEDNNIPKDAVILNNTRWKSPTDCDGVYYNKTLNIIMLNDNCEDIEKFNISARDLGGYVDNFDYTENCYYIFRRLKENKQCMSML